MDVKRASRKGRGVSRPAAPSTEPPTVAAEPTAHGPSGKSRWKHDLHRTFALVRLDLPPMLVHVWEVMWDHLPASNEPFPLSHGTIGREGGIDRTAAARATRELERLGLLVCVRRGRLGSPDANIWRFPQSLPDIPKRERRKPPARPST
jgi:hypothetical protein